MRMVIAFHRHFSSHTDTEKCRCPMPPSPRILLGRRRWTGCTDRYGQRRWHGSPSLVSTHTCPTPIHIPRYPHRAHTRSSDTDTIPDTACPFLGSCTCTAARGSGRRRRYSEAAAGAGRQPTPAARCSKAAREANKTVPVPYCHAASLPCRRPALPSAPVKRGRLALTYAAPKCHGAAPRAYRRPHRDPSSTRRLSALKFRLSRRRPANFSISLVGRGG